MSTAVDNFQVCRQSDLRFGDAVHKFYVVGKTCVELRGVIVLGQYRAKLEFDSIKKLDSIKLEPIKKLINSYTRTRLDSKSIQVRLD